VEDHAIAKQVDALMPVTFDICSFSAKVQDTWFGASS